MDYPILSYHSHSFLEQLRRHFQNLDTFLNEILPIEKMFDYFYAYTFVIETDNNNQILKNNRLSLSYLFILAYPDLCSINTQVFVNHCLKMI